MLPWVVDPPVFLPFQLNHKRLNVVIMWSKALCPWWCQVPGEGQHTFNTPPKNESRPESLESSQVFPLEHLHIGSSHAAELLLKDGQHVPHGGGESLGIQHSKGAATLEKQRYRFVRWLVIFKESAVQVTVMLHYKKIPYIPYRSPTQ